MELAPRLVRACSGHLVLSGIRAIEAEAVSSVFARLGVRELRSESDHEWCGITLACG
jgi:ribosomal protein L11 methylase PrmA